MSEDAADVIVIGAGVAGLRAAGELARAGKRIVLLEARERIGGRIWTQRAAGWAGPIELGAEFIHGGNDSLESLIRNGRIKKQRIGEQHWFVGDGVRRKRPDVWDRIDEVMQRIGPRYRKSFGRWLKTHGDEIDPTDRTLAETFVKGFQGAAPELMSAHTLFEASNEDEEQSRISRGYGELVGVLERRMPANRVQVHLNTVVERITWKRGEVRAFANGKTWRARAILVTVPLGVLRAGGGEVGAIRFDPALSVKRRMWRNLAIGHAMRVVLRMRADVWRRGVVPAEMRAKSGRAFGFLHSAEEFFPVWWSEAPRPILVGWTGGPAVTKLAGRPPREIFEKARGTLAKLLGCRETALAKSILDWRTHDWAMDPFTRGAYSFSVAGKENAPEKIARPVGGTIFFAGEATADPLELGTVHGALASGERAAREMIVTLKRRSR